MVTVAGSWGVIRDLREGAGAVHGRTRSLPQPAHVRSTPVERPSAAHAHRLSLIQGWDSDQSLSMRSYRNAVTKDIALGSLLR